MNLRILIFNLVFYAVTLSFYVKGRQDPSSSLGYGFFVYGFWGVALVILLILMTKKIIQPKTILDKIGIVTATPLLCIFLVGLSITLNDSPISEGYFEKGNYRYKVLNYEYRATGNRKRIEYYKNSEPVNGNYPAANFEEWVKDSTWIYFSKSGDTMKIVKYNDGLLISSEKKRSPRS